MSADTAPAAMPGEIEIAETIVATIKASKLLVAVYSADDDGCRMIDGDVDLPAVSRAVLNLFAPILAEKERLAMRRWTAALAQAQDWRNLAEKAEARALAAEAALAAERAESEQLQATIRKAHVAMTLACALPSVASEYDFSEAIASTEAALARRAAAIRAEGE